MKKLLGLVLLTGITLSSTQSVFAEKTKTQKETSVAKGNYVEERKAFLAAKIALPETSAAERQHYIDEFNALCSGQTIKATFIKYKNAAKVGLAIAGTIGAAWLFTKAKVNAYPKPFNPENLRPCENEKFFEGPTKSQCFRAPKSIIESRLQEIKQPIGSQKICPAPYLAEAERLYTEASQNIDKLVNTPEKSTKKLCGSLRQGFLCSSIEPLGEKAMKFFQENNLPEYQIKLLEKMDAAHTQLPSPLGFGKGVQTENQFNRELNKLNAHVITAGK